MSDYKNHLQVHNKKELKQIRKDLRNNATTAEAVLWKSLQRSQLEGQKFRRQHSVGNYVLDFYCPAEKLAIELDGNHHFTDAGYEYDLSRTAFLNDLKIQVLRFENKLIFQNIESVLEAIKSAFRK
jgi:very-short-patch-repair endonuclease